MRAFPGSLILVAVLLGAAGTALAQSGSQERKLWWSGRYGDPIKVANLDGEDIHDTSIVSERFLVAGNKIYYVDTDGLWRADHNGENTELICDLQGIDTLVDMRLQFSYVYFVSGAGLSRVPRTPDPLGCVPEALVPPGGLGYVTGFAIAHDKLYWINNEDCGLFCGTIYAATLEGGFLGSVVTNLYDPRHLEYDPGTNRLYWREDDTDGGSIWRANLSGSKWKIINDAGQGWGLGLDLVNDKLYWSKHFTSSGSSLVQLQRADLDGSNQEVVLAGDSFSDVFSGAHEIQFGEVHIGPVLSPLGLAVLTVALGLAGALRAVRASR